jgi:hypothetical protein
MENWCLKDRALWRAAHIKVMGLRSALKLNDNQLLKAQW